MLLGLRTWLARALLPDGALEAPAPPRLEAAPKKTPPRARPKPAPIEADDDAAAAREELARRASDLEAQLRRSEERLKRAEAQKRSAEESAASAGARETEATLRAKRAEAALKKLEAAPRGGDRRGKGKAIEAKLAEAVDRGERFEHRAREAERREADTIARADALDSELAALREELTSLRAALAAERDRPAARPAAEPDGALRRGAPRSHVDVHFSPGDDCLVAIVRELGRAASTADICVFTITDDRIARAVIDAHRRGVTVRVITDNDKAHDEGSDVGRIARAGVEVREDQSPFHMHHKFAVFDGRTVLTGSYNWTRGAAEKNQENLVVTDDARLVGPFGREFASLWSRLGRA